MRLFCLLILALLPLRAEPLALIRAGESFRYRLNWGVLIGVGEIRIDAAQPGASTDGTRKVSIDQHEAILMACRQGDFETASTLLRDHILDAKEFIPASLK